MKNKRSKNSMCILTRGVLMLFLLLFCGFCIVFSVSARNGAAKDNQGAQVPILMYHSVCDGSRVSSEYILPVKEFERDLQYLARKGYTAVFLSELVDFQKNGTPLPEKPVVITFDDGHLNTLTSALPLLQKYDMKAVVSVVGEFAETYSAISDRDPTYAYLTFEDIAFLHQSGRFEIGNHTYALHKTHGRFGCAKLPAETEEQYQKMLFDDLTRLQEELTENCGVTPTVFAYPYGSISDAAMPVLKRLGFETVLTCTEKTNILTGSSDELMSLGRYNRSSSFSTVEFFKKLGIE